MSRIILCLAILINIASALDITTTKGEVYRHCEAIKAEPDGIRFTHAYGTARVPFEELSADLQKQYGYDPVKAAAYRQAVEAARVAAAKQRAEEEFARQQEAARMAGEQARQTALANVEKERVAGEQTRQAALTKAEKERVAEAERRQDVRTHAAARDTGLFAGIGFGIALLLVGIVFYFLPTIVAMRSGKENVAAIFVLNLFLGWSLLGWVLALVWALTRDRDQVVTQTIHVHGAMPHLVPPPPLQPPGPRTVRGHVIEPEALPSSRRFLK